MTLRSDTYFILQVGLIGINILGNEIGEKNQELEFNNNACRPTTLIPCKFDGNPTLT